MPLSLRPDPPRAGICSEAAKTPSNFTVVTKYAILCLWDNCFNGLLWNILTPKQAECHHLRMIGAIVIVRDKLTNDQGRHRDI